MRENHRFYIQHAYLTPPPTPRHTHTHTPRHELSSDGNLCVRDFTIIIIIVVITEHSTKHTSTGSRRRQTDLSATGRPVGDEPSIAAFLETGSGLGQVFRTSAAIANRGLHCGAIASCHP